MNYTERKAIEIACYDAWKQDEQRSTTASAALSAAIDAKIAARRNTGEAWTQADQKQLDERREYAADAEKKENAARLAYYISADNARRALIEELTGTACEILNKYSGKPYGEKTREKISAEIEARTQYSAYIKSEYCRSTITFYPKAAYNRYASRLETSYYHSAETDPAPILIENKIQPTAPENWKPDYCDPYKDDGTPEEIAAAVIEAYREAEAAYKTYQTAQSKYNALTPTQARRIDCNGPHGLF